jgi:hypothetical protein
MSCQETYTNRIYQRLVGTTKTIVRTMGKNGPAIDPSAQVFCIVLILVSVSSSRYRHPTLTKP